MNLATNNVKLTPSTHTSNFYIKSYEIDGIFFPFPICNQCRKQVNTFKVTEELMFGKVPVYKFEATCHEGAYEMYRVEKAMFANPSTQLIAGAAF